MAYKTTVATEPFAQQCYDAAVMDRALPVLIHEQFADKEPLPKQSSKTMTFRLFESWEPATIALTEGTTPDPSDYTVSQITTCVDQYGRTAGVTDMVDDTKPDPHILELAEMLGEDMGNTKDVITATSISPNIANMYRAQAAGGIVGGAAEVTTAAVVDATMLDLMHRVMRNQNAPYWTRMIRPGKGENSWPIGSAYWVVTHPNIAYTIRDLTGFIPVQAYANQQNVALGEFGSYKNLRFVESTNSYMNAGAAAVGADSYYLSFFAPHAFAVVPLSGQDGKLYRHPFGSGDDVLEQRYTLGWKGCWAMTTKNDDFSACLTVLSE